LKNKKKPEKLHLERGVGLDQNVKPKSPSHQAGNGTFDALKATKAVAAKAQKAAVRRPCRG